MADANGNAEYDFICLMGETAGYMGLNRTVGQIYGLLYLSDEPVPLETLATKLKISKASASLNVRELEKWEAVRQIWVPGSRKDFYEADRDFVNVIYKRFKNRIKKLVEETSRNMDKIKANQKDRSMSAKMDKIRNFILLFTDATNLLPDKISTEKASDAVKMLKRLIK